MQARLEILIKKDDFIGIYFISAIKSSRVLEFFNFSIRFTRKGEKGLQTPVIYAIMNGQKYISAPLAQMDRALASDARCRRFESAMVRQKEGQPTRAVPLFSCHDGRTKNRLPFSAFAVRQNGGVQPPRKRYTEAKTEEVKSNTRAYPFAVVWFRVRHGAPKKRDCPCGQAFFFRAMTGRRTVCRFWLLP